MHEDSSGSPVPPRQLPPPPPVYNLLSPPGASSKMHPHGILHFRESSCNSIGRCSTVGVLTVPNQSRSSSASSPTVFRGEEELNGSGDSGETTVPLDGTGTLNGGAVPINTSCDPSPTQFYPPPLEGDEGEVSTSIPATGTPALITVDGKIGNGQFPGTSSSGGVWSVDCSGPMRNAQSPDDNVADAGTLGVLVGTAEEHPLGGAVVRTARVDLEKDADGSVQEEKVLTWSWTGAEGKRNHHHNGEKKVDEVGSKTSNGFDEEKALATNLLAFDSDARQVASAAMAGGALENRNKNVGATAAGVAGENLTIRCIL